MMLCMIGVFGENKKYLLIKSIQEMVNKFKEKNIWDFIRKKKDKN